MGEFKVLLLASNYKNANGEFLLDAMGKFGGYTVGPICEGVWVDAAKVVHRDTVVPVYIATDDTSGVLRLVDRYRETTGEACVYLKHPNGTVTLVGLK